MLTMLLPLPRPRYDGEAKRTAKVTGTGRYCASGWFLPDPGYDGEPAEEETSQSPTPRTLVVELVVSSPPIGGVVPRRHKDGGEEGSELPPVRGDTVGVPVPTGAKRYRILMTPAMGREGGPLLAWPVGLDRPPAGKVEEGVREILLAPYWGRLTSGQVAPGAVTAVLVVEFET
jgi:hypothetical protein